MNRQHKRQPDEQMKRWGIKKANEDYSETESSSDDEFLTSRRIKTVNSLLEENQVLSIQGDRLQDRVSSFGAELEVAKKIINSLVSQQIHTGHFSYNELSDEIHQEHHKGLYQRVHVPNTETEYRLATEQYEDQDKSDSEMRCLRKKEEVIVYRNTSTFQTSRKCKRKVERHWY